METVRWFKFSNHLTPVFILLTSFFRLISSSSHAQSGSVTGKVIEKVSLEPLQFATVFLFDTFDTIAPVQIASTDIEGAYLFEDIRPGSYYIEASFIGFKINRTLIFEHKNNTKLDPVILEEDKILLEDVEISGERTNLAHDIDKKIYYVEKDIVSETGSVSDVLQNINPTEPEGSSISS